MDPLRLIGAAAGYALSVWLSRRALAALRLTRRNFQGAQIPAATGITLLLATAVFHALALAPIHGMVALGFGLLGLLDDVRGDRSVGGFRGHLGALRRGRLTTGAAKLLGGGVVALGAAWWLDAWTPWWIPVDAALIALGANTVNLLDLRPGRARAAFALLLTPWAVASALSPRPGWWLPLGTLAASCLEWRSDARGKTMLGDTGANLLGAVAGLSLATALPPAGRLICAGLLFGINVASERVSFSVAIERVAWLRWLDRRLGVRG